MSRDSSQGALQGALQGSLQGSSRDLSSGDATLTLLDAINRSLCGSRFEVTQVNESADALRVRLLELGIVRGVSLKAQRRGAQVLIRLRGDQLMLRGSEARHIQVRALPELEI